jgi:DNA-binding SARP family transcriptional activator
MSRNAIALARRLSTAVAALLVIAALVVGVPLLLWRLVGWPLPGELPAPDGISRALTRSTVSDAVIIKTLALLGWSGWVLVCWSLATECWAVARGIPARRVRFAAPFQSLARHLVTSVSLLAVTGAAANTPAPVPIATAAATAAGGRWPGLDATVALTRSAAPATTPAAPAADALDPAPPTVTHYTVQRRDSLWKIAGCQLGDPLRWRELWELNRGRDFGGVTFSDPNLIYSGWVIDVPVAAVTAAPLPGLPESAVAAPSHVPSPAPAVPSPPGSAAGTATSVPEAPNPAPSPVDSAPTTSVTTTAPQEPTTEARSNGSGPDNGSPRSGDGQLVAAPSHVPLFVGGTVLATSIVLLLTRLRRSQARRRSPGQAPHLPPAATAATETALRRAGDPPRMQRLLVTLRAFAAGLRDADLPMLAAVRAGDPEIEVLLASPAGAAPPGFDCDVARRVFTTEVGLTTTALEGLAGDTVASWPAIVSVGSIGDDPVLLDLEAAGILTVDGPDAADTVRRIAAELAATPASDLIEVVVLGEDFDLAGSERIRKVLDFEEAIDMLARAATSTQAALDRVGDATVAVARRDHSAEQGWGVVVLVSLAPLTDSQRDRLAEVMRPGCGVAAVIVGAPVAGCWSLATGPTVRLEPHGFDLTPATLPEDHLKAVDALLTDATTDDSRTPPKGEDREPCPVYIPDPAHALTEESDADVEVRVLGPVNLHGVSAINRRRTVEVIVYLALHPGGVSPERLKTAIWPEAEPTQDSFNVTIHRARAALGVDRDGNHHLPHAVTNGGSYSVGPHVTTDLARFNDLVRRSRSAPEDGIEADLLRRAIGLLRGQVLEGVRGYEWAFTEGTVTKAEATISDAAHRLAQLELARGDPDAATWAAIHGLKAVPGSEPLFRDRMEAAHLNGDPAAVDRIVEELCHYVDTLDPLEDLHPDTLALWRRIGRNLSSQRGLR